MFSLLYDWLLRLAYPIHQTDFSLVDYQMVFPFVLPDKTFFLEFWGIRMGSKLNV